MSRRDLEDDDQPLLPLDERFRRAEQLEFEFYSDEELEQREKQKLRRVERFLRL